MREGNFMANYCSPFSSPVIKNYRSPYLFVRDVHMAGAFNECLCRYRCTIHHDRPFMMFIGEEYCLYIALYTYSYTSRGAR